MSTKMPIPSSEVTTLREPGRLRLIIPRIGLKKWSPIAYSVLILSVIVVSWFACIVPTFPTASQGEQILFVGFFGPCWLGAVAWLLWILHKAFEQCVLIATKNSLVLARKSFLKSLELEWTAGEIAGFSVGSADWGVEGGACAELKVVATDGEKIGILSGRDPEELDLIAMQLREFYGLPAQA